MNGMKITESTTLNLNLLRPSDTIPVWNVSDRSLCSLEVAEGGLSAVVTALAAGSAQVSVTSNCDFGSGTREHHTVFDIVIDNDATVPVVEVQSVEEPKSPYWGAEPEVIN